jgi:hypothetical protein
MSPEVIQPQMERPDLENRLMWSSLSQIHSDWLRKITPQLGLDTEKLILGDALGSIIGDDSNIFGYRDFFNPTTVELSRTLLFIRMTWEEGTPEVPENIRNQIAKIHGILESMDWTDETRFNQARTLWERDVRDFTRREMDEHKELQEAVHYDIKMAEVWSPYWNEFLYGNKKLSDSTG